MGEKRKMKLTNEIDKKNVRGGQDGQNKLSEGVKWVKKYVKGK